MVVYQKIQRELSEKARVSIRVKEVKKEKEEDHERPIEKDPSAGSK